jgi:arylsulfatase A-like enzyme
MLAASSRNLGASLLLGLFAACADAGPRELPSIVLITIDTLRADHLGCYGYVRDTSPNLDRFAAQAVLFESALTTMATTLPAHISLMTSTLTVSHGVKRNIPRNGGLPAWVSTASEPDVEAAERSGRSGPTFPTLAQLVRNLGYETAAFVSAGPLKTHSGLQLGFHEFNQPAVGHRTAAETNDAVLAWLDSRPQRPFFLWVHYFDPHFPFEPPPPYDTAFEGDRSAGEVLRQRNVAEWKDPDIQKWIDLYDGEILYLDSQIQRLFDRMRELGHWADSAIAVAGDHGEGLYQHGWWDHGRIYNEQLFVPLIIKLPDGVGPPSHRSSKLASLIDVLPSLVATLELPVPAAVASRFEGVDLFRRGSRRDYAFAERTHLGRNWEPGRKYALVSPEWKYFHLTEANDELYDMAADRGETRNVISARPEIAARMKQRILAIIGDERQPAARSRLPLEKEEGVPEPLIEELRALGYVEE